MPDRPLKPWIGFERDGIQEGAVLVFARDYREARKWAYGGLSAWDCEFIDVRVRMLRNNPERFMRHCKGRPDVIIDIPADLMCGNCKLWGNRLDALNLCQECAGDRLAFLGKARYSDPIVMVDGRWTAKTVNA